MKSHKILIHLKLGAGTEFHAVDLETPEGEWIELAEYMHKPHAEAHARVLRKALAWRPEGR